MMPTLSRVYGILAVAGLVAATGCLRKELTHTIYVSPAGVTWTAIETDVRSDDTDAGKRMLEEQDYLLAARAGQHGVAKALRALDATELDTTILRRDRPFTVVTQGRFGDLAELAAAMMKLARVRGDASIEREGCERTFRAWFDSEQSTDENTDVLADVISEAMSYRIVLTEGRFLRAEGFTIEEDGAIATIGAPATTEDGLARVSLTWSEGWCAAPTRAPHLATGATR
jgi:hypothetical protein